MLIAACLRAVLCNGARSRAWPLVAFMALGCGGRADQVHILPPAPSEREPVVHEEPAPPKELDDETDPAVPSPEPRPEPPYALDCAQFGPSLCEADSFGPCTLSCTERADGCSWSSEFVPLGSPPDGYGLGFGELDPDGRYFYFSHHWAGGRAEEHAYSWTADEGITALDPSFGISAGADGLAERYARIAQVGRGGIVLGAHMDNASSQSGFLWSRSTGLTALGFQPLRMSVDGGVVVGLRNGRAVVWTRDGGMRRLDGGNVDEAGNGTPDRGATVSDSGAFATFVDAAGRTQYWSAPGGLEDVGELIGGQTVSPQSVIMNANGDVIFGSLGDNENDVRSAFRWSAASGVTDLGTLPELPPGTGYSPRFVTSDGAVVVGFLRLDGYNIGGFRWTASEGMVPIIGSSAGGAPLYVSPDGATVVGTNYLKMPSGFRWTARDGVTNIEGAVTGIALRGDLLIQHEYGGELTLRRFDGALSGPESEWIDALPGRPTPAGWSSAYLTKVSENGRVLAGSATDPSGRSQGWLVRLIESCPE